MTAAVAAFGCGSEQEADLARAAARRRACSDDHESVLRMMASIDPNLSQTPYPPLIMSL